MTDLVRTTDTEILDKYSHVYKAYAAQAHTLTHLHSQAAYAYIDKGNS
jgi:hypothetical protein